MSSSKIDLIKELYPNEDFLIMGERFDDKRFDYAIIGVDENNSRIVYDIDEVINILIMEGMDVDDAIEFYEYNIAGAYVGDKTPVFMRKIIEL
jgi:hypothetical protein